MSRMQTRAGVSVTLLLSLVSGCGKGDGASSTAPRSSAPPRDLVARDAWHLEVQGESRPMQMIGVAGGALVAWEVEGEAVFPGRPAINTGHEPDVVVTRISAAGGIESVHAIGADGDEEIVAMVAADPAALIIRGTAAMTLAGTRLAPPPPVDEFSIPTWGALVSLDASGAPTAAMALDGAAASWRALRVADGWVIASNHDRDDATRAVVQRIRGGEVLWSRELAGVSVSRLVEIDGGVAALTRAKALGIVLLDLERGAVIASHEVERMGGSFSGDLGDLVGAVRAGQSTVFYGQSGRESVQVGGKSLSHSIEPLTVVLDRGEVRRSQLLDVTGDVVAVGTVAGHPAALVDVIHNGALYGGLDVPHRGSYLVLGGHDGAPALVPLVQYRYERDDWENQPAQMVLGGDRMMSLAALVEDGRVWRAGRCEEPGRGCVVQHQIAAAPR